MRLQSPDTVTNGIILGATRVAFVTILALIAKYRERRSKFNPDFKPTVSVVIAAFNEEKVIAREAFRAAYTVLMHPRCMNCHPAGQAPLQGKAE
ncbi:MAG TPA: hypothetical protein VF850_08315 [Gemmatimonadaceae bacterium]